MTTVTNICYSPTHQAEMSAIVGTAYGLWNPVLKIIDSCVHTGGGTMQEFRALLNTETGKVFKVIENGISYSKVIEFESVDAYRKWDSELRKLERDPETGRLFTDYGRGR